MYHLRDNISFQEAAPAMLKHLVVGTPLQKTLEFLVQNHQWEFHVREIGRRLQGCSLSAVNRALRDLAAVGLVKRQRQGRNVLNRVDSDSPVVRPYRILLNILDLHDLVVRLREISSRIVLYGSRADGTNDASSDYDLQIVTSNPEEVRTVIRAHNLGELIRPLVMTPAEAVSFPTSERELYREIEKGTVLWTKG
jgi:predicted nucleotidyltransferase